MYTYMYNIFQKEKSCTFFWNNETCLELTDYLFFI